MYVNHSANMQYDEMNAFLCSQELLFKNQIVTLYFELIALCLEDVVASRRKHKYLGQIPL